MIECMRTEARNSRVAEQRWIPVKYHELTEEERKECLFSADIKHMIDCKLPDDEQEIIVTDGRHVWVDTCIVNDGYALDSGHDWIEDVIAWMPLPEPFRESEDSMERLTEKNDVGSHYFPKCFEKCGGLGASGKCDNCENTISVCEKLGAYEDAEEQGLILRLPCKVGSNIYRITDDGVEVAVCREMTVADKEMYIESVTLCDWISFDEIGKSVFLTRDEAEAKLKEMED